MAPLCFRRHRFAPEIIQHAIWLYLRFTLSYRVVGAALSRPHEELRVLALNVCSIELP